MVNLGPTEERHTDWRVYRSGERYRIGRWQQYEKVTFWTKRVVGKGWQLVWATKIDYSGKCEIEGHSLAFIEQELAELKALESWEANKDGPWVLVGTDTVGDPPPQHVFPDSKAPMPNKTSKNEP